MLFYETLLLPLKQSAMVLMISAVVFLASTSVPGINVVVSVMAEEGQSAEAAPAPGLLTADQLVDLVGPVALYPDELLAITLPAATYPLEIVQAARYLEKHKKNPDLKPNEKWDESVLGLLNYPEVIDLMNKDLDWTWKLGAAVTDQQGDVMDAVQQFRNQTHTAGNLDSNEKQIIIVEKEIIKIVSATPEVIYVPTYQPSTVVVVQSAPYPYYYSAPYPYYYNPAAVFWTGVFIGAAVRYGVGWGRYGRGDTNINVSRGGNTVNIGSGNRSGGGNRPGAGNRAGGGNRPGGGTGQRPSAGTRPGSRPSTGQRPSTRPSTGQRPSSMDRKQASRQPSRSSTGQRPSSMDRSRASSGSRPSSSRQGSFSGQRNSGRSASRNSQRGSSSRASQSRSRSSSSRSRSSASRGGGGRSGGGGRRR